MVRVLIAALLLAATACSIDTNGDGLPDTGASITVDAGPLTIKCMGTPGAVCEIPCVGICFMEPNRDITYAFRIGCDPVCRWEK